MEETYKKKEEKKEEKILKERKLQCPECGTENELEAKFCEECGYSLGIKRCPKCGAVVLENADICESCGEWLLEGQCKFCYSPLEEDAKFCAECGNPVNGVECPKCHFISYFDFCKFCDIPLTKQALQTIDVLKNSEQIREITEVIEQEEKDAWHSLEKLELEKMRNYQQKVKQSEAKRNTHNLFSKEETLDKKTQQLQEKKKPQKEKTTDGTPDILEKIQHKKFTNNQEARRFFGALKILLPMKKEMAVTKKTLVGWLCNAYNCLHSEGPQGCAAPSSGGTWVFEEKTVFEEKIEIREVEI